MKIILYSSMFITFYLALFFAVNFKPSPSIIVRNRIRNLRTILFNELYEIKSTEEKIKWLLELEQRRDEVRDELKYNIKLNSKTEKIVNNLIDKSWDEIIVIIRARAGHAALALKIASVDTKELVQKAKDTNEIGSEKDNEDAEVLEELADEVEEIEEVETLDDVEEIEEIEEIEEVETLEDAENIEEVEALEDAEVIEEVEALEEIESEEATSLEEINEIDEIEEAEPLKDAEDKDIEEFAEEAEFTEDIEIPQAPSKDLPKLKDKPIKAGKSIPAEKENLMQLGSEFEIYEEIDLPEITSPIENDNIVEAENETNPSNELIARALVKIRSSDTDIEPKSTSGKKGLLALASEIEFSPSYPVNEPELDEKDVKKQIDEIIKMDIVSPFVSMFSSLDNKKTEEK